VSLVNEISNAANGAAKMNIKRELEKLAAKVGATVEEDTGSRDTRTLQICAPAGMVWESQAGMHIPVIAARGTTAEANDYNVRELDNASDIISCGVRPMTPEEKELCAED
jgi:hypothetical protein